MTPCTTISTNGQRIYPYILALQQCVLVLLNGIEFSHKLYYHLSLTRSLDGYRSFIYSTCSITYFRGSILCITSVRMRYTSSKCGLRIDWGRASTVSCIYLQTLCKRSPIIGPTATLPVIRHRTKTPRQVG